MKDKTIKNIRLCCYVAMAICLIWTVVVAVGIIGDALGRGSTVHPIDWSINKGVKIGVFVCFLVGMAGMVPLCLKVIYNTLKGLRENIVFPKCNVSLLFWMVLADFVYLFGFWNLQILWDENLVLALQPTNFIMPFFLLFFAFMYKVAADAVEENSLTI